MSVEPRPPMVRQGFRQGARLPPPASGRVIAVASLLLVASLGFLPAVRADSASVEIMPATLPSPVDFDSSVYIGGYAFTFGGANGPLSSAIDSYTPSTDTAATIPGTLPSARAITSAATDGRDAYIFGGCAGASCGTYLRDIVRFDPSTHSVTRMNGQLSQGLYGTSAVWTGSTFLIFGGGCGGCAVSTIQSYDPATDTTTQLAAHLPIGVSYSSAVWTGTVAYIFGGYDGAATVDNIQEYDPATGQASVLSVTLPGDVYRTSAVWSPANNEAYIFGGSVCSSCSSEASITAFDPTNQTATDVGVSLPTALCCSGAVWDPDTQTAFILGGLASSSVNEIVQFTPPTPPGPPPPQPPLPPTGVLAVTANNLGEIDIYWQAATSPNSPVLSYNIYRGTHSGTEQPLATVSAPQTFFTDTGLPDGALRFYEVTAVNAVGESARSLEVRNATLPEAPTNLQANLAPTVSTPNPLPVQLAWAKPGGENTAPLWYNVYRGFSMGTETFLSPASQNAYTDRTCPAGSRCFYYVTAVNMGGEGAASNGAVEFGTAVP
ncbi:MAG: Kelch repeat-containing protein [Thermoplasmatota archaeon]